MTEIENEKDILCFVDFCFIIFKTKPMNELMSLAI